jgi:hypothetical protein
MNTFAVLPFVKGKQHRRKVRSSRTHLPRSKSTLTLERLENRALPSTLSFTATNTDFTTYTNEPVATPMPIPQFDTMGGLRTLKSVEIISSIRMDTSASGTITNRSSQSLTYEGMLTNATISVTGSGFGSPLSATIPTLLDTGPVNCPGRTTTPIGPFSASLTAMSDVTLISPSALAPFIGTGNTSYTNSASADSINAVTGGSNFTNNVTITSTGSATVEVIYTFVTNPSLVTTASLAVTLGTTAPTLSDSAVLSRGASPTGLVTFTLTGPGGFSYTQTDTVIGNGTYTAADTLPTTGVVAGTYTWSAHYSGDGNNTGANDQGGTEEESFVSPAHPTMVTAASEAATLGITAPTLTDSAVLSAGFSETGTITFTLTGPGGFSYTQIDTVSGSGTYTAGVTPPTTRTVAGTYTWSASYSGDSNNRGTIDQGGTAEQTTVSQASPGLVTAAGPSVTLGTTAPALRDSAVLLGGFFEKGTITFTLTGPGGFSYTQTDTVNGNGTYMAGDTLPTTGLVAGTYTWSAHYSGDGNNASANAQGGTGQQTVVSVANPTVVTTASGAVTLGTTAPILSDSAVLSGGFFEKGTLTFTLTGPGGFSYTQTDAVTGNGTYTARDTLPTTGHVQGTYTWSEHYSGDANNVSASDPGGTAEQTIVSAAHPTAVTTASGAVTLGITARTLTDSAVLSNGFFETGTITFTLTGPGGFSYTQTDAVHGNGTYTAGAALPTTGLVAGIYAWSASFSGDANNLSASDQGRTAEQTIVSAAHPTVVTTASGAVALGITAPTLTDSAVLSDGFFETGTITFTLMGPGGFSYTQTNTVHGNGTYTAGATLPTTSLVAGSYAWSASYSGDANNRSANDQAGTAEQTIIRAANPVIVTAASSAGSLSTTAPTLTDSAVLSGGFLETGTITFILTGPEGFSYTQTDTVHSNGTYTASDTLPTTATVTGTYTWSASYSGDSNNTGASDQGGTAEETTVNQATPSLLTTANPAFTLGTTAPTLTDSAVLSGGFFPTGTITFTLTGPGGFSYTQTDTVSGNGTYTAGDTLPATGVDPGTYIWSAHYSGDANNAIANDQGGVAVQTVVGAVAATLSLSGPTSVMAGSAYNLTVTVNEPGIDVVTSLIVNWDDGTAETIPLSLNHSGSFTVSHEYASGPAYRLVSATFADEVGVHAADNMLPVVVLVPGLDQFATAISTPGDPGTATVTSQIQGTLTLPPGLALNDLGLLLVGTYFGNPRTQVPQGNALKFFDIEAELHVTGDPSDTTLTVRFSIPDGSDPKHLLPQFYDGTTWRPISGASISVLVDANGHRFVELTFSSHTFPNIAQLGGTVFTVAVTTPSTTNVVIFPPVVSAAPPEVMEPNFASPATFVTSSQLTLTLAASPESSSGGSDAELSQDEPELLRSLQWLESSSSKGGSDEEALPGDADLLRSLQWLQGQEDRDKTRRLLEPARKDGSPPVPPKPTSHGPSEPPPAAEPGDMIYFRLHDDLPIRADKSLMNIVLADRHLDELDLAAALAQAGPHVSSAQTADSQLALAALAIGALAREWSTDEENRRPY